ncbi:MAG: hypothetical protein IPK29_06930 [Betaproteobacteria bacterium]|nr:hypothetical protein [Betaproteobacteria bacterium]
MVRTKIASPAGNTTEPSPWSITRQGTPRQPSSQASARPTGPAPTTSTGVSMLRTLMTGS